MTAETVLFLWRLMPSTSHWEGAFRGRLRTLVGVFVCAALLPAAAVAEEFHVSPTGSDSSNGSESAPFASLTKANDAASAGDTIWVHGGTYLITTQLVLSKGGSGEDNRTKIWAAPGEKPVLDASNFQTSNPAVDVPVVLVTGSWMHLRGLEIGPAKVGASGDHSYSLLRTKNASNNIFELLDLHHGFGPGLFIDTGTGGNLILNCDSHDNYDKDGSQGDGQNGDGFGVHYQMTGPSTVIRGCRAWMNSDDGYDYIYHEVPVVTEGNFAMRNGYGSSGNGNGFKVGSSGTGIRHVVQNNVAWDNKASGFYANHSSGGNTWYNNTSFDNGTQYNMLAASFASDGQTIETDGITLMGDKVHIMRNNVGFPNKNANMNGVDSAMNSWDLDLSEVEAAFLSTSDEGCTGPREADGSIPEACAFLKLTEGSSLIDAGVDVGLPYAGSAPDLGAYEFGLSDPMAGGSGGASTGSGGVGSGGGGGANAGGASVGGASAGGAESGGTDPGGAGGSVGLGGGESSGGSQGTGGSLGVGGASGQGAAVGAGSSQGAGGVMSPAVGGAGTSGSGVPDAGGCGCRVSAPPRRGLVLVGLGLGFLLIARRRRSLG